MVLVIGAWCEGIGLALRLGVRQNLHSTGLYIAQYLFVVLSVSHTYKYIADWQPCAFLAGDYILLGRLVSYFDASAYLKPLKPGWVSWAFIISDSECHVRYKTDISHHLLDSGCRRRPFYIRKHPASSDWWEHFPSGYCRSNGQLRPVQRHVDLVHRQSVCHTSDRS